MSSYLPENQMHFVEEGLCPSCQKPLEQEESEGRLILVCEPCSICYDFISPDEQMIDAACLGCDFDLTAVLEEDIVPESILWDRCPECGDHLVTLMSITSD